MTIIYKILFQVRKKFTIVKATTLEDLEITLDDLANAVKFITFGLAKNKGKEQGAAGGGGGMPGLASRKLDIMVKIARNLDLIGLFSVADRIM